jgi:chaperone BCS1
MVRPMSRPYLRLSAIHRLTCTQGVGVALTALRKSLVLGSAFLQRRMLVTLEVSNRDRAFGWVLAWMAHQAQLQASASGGSGGILRKLKNGTLASGLARSHQLSVETRFQQHKNGSSSVMFDLVAGPGVHWFRYQNAWMQVSWLECTV